ncbi:putative xylogalacturonan beta-1,3-xylosyltransferase [Helianthus anomalus]
MFSGKKKQLLHLRKWLGSGAPIMVEALYMGCVPVLIMYYYAKPFNDILDWHKFSIDIGLENIPNLKTILMRISQRKYIRLQRNGVQVRKHFVVNLPPKRYDVFSYDSTFYMAKKIEYSYSRSSPTMINYLGYWITKYAY